MGSVGVDVVLPFPPAQAENPKGFNRSSIGNQVLQHFRFDLGSSPFRRAGPGLILLRVLIEVLLTK